MRYPFATGLVVGFALSVLLVAGVAQRWGNDIAGALSSLPAPWATMISAIVGASILAWQAGAALNNIIAGQNHRAKIEAEARADQARLDRVAKEADRRLERDALAAALAGELNATLQVVHTNMQSVYAQQLVMEAAAKDRTMAAMTFAPMMPAYRVPVFEANIGKLGLLGSSIAGDVTRVLGRAVAKETNVEMPKVIPEILVTVYKALHSGHTDWAWEIAQVYARLLSLQGIGTDPGSLSDKAATEKFRGQAQAAAVAKTSA